jgi:membrane protein
MTIHQSPRRSHWLSRFQGLVDVCTDAVTNFTRNGDANQAAAIALYAFLSIIPLFILSMILAWKVLGSHSLFQAQLLNLLEDFHPGFSTQLLAQLGQIEDKRRMLGWIGIGTLVWLSSLIFGAIETALNISFRARLQRNYLHSKLLAFAMIPLGWGIVLASLTLTAIATFLHHGALMRYVLPWLVSSFFLAAVYRLIPTRKLPMRILLTGSLIFATLMEPAKHIFAWYVAHHTRYHEIFGSLETVVILVIWVFYVSLLFLLCAELMSSIQRRDLLLFGHTLLNRNPARNRNSRLVRKFGREFAAETIIFKEGSEGREMYYILFGRIRLEKKSGKGRKILSIMGPGNYFGEMAALADAPRTATAIADEECQLLMVDATLMSNLLRENEEVALHMLQEFSHRLRHMNSAMDEHGKIWLRASILLHLMDSGQLMSSEAELAEGCGSEPEEIQEALQELTDLQLVSCEGGICRCLNRERAWARVMSIFSNHEGSTP